MPHSEKTLLRKPTLPRIYSIDGLRGLFAMSVMFYHYSIWSQTRTDYLHIGGTVQTWWDYFEKIAVYNVCGFFVISGFSMYYIYGQKDFKKGTVSLKFFYNRFLRIAPIFWIVCLAMIVIHSFNGTVIDSSYVLRAVLHLTFLFGFYNLGMHSLVLGGWSLGIEWVFYLFFPALIILINRRIINLFWIAVASLVSWQIHLWYIFDPNLPYTRQWWKYSQPFYHVIFFVLGMVLGECYRRWPKAININLAIAGILIAYLIFFIFDLRSLGQLHMVYGWHGTLFGLLIVCVVGFAAYIDVQNSFLIKICAFLGSISYPLYLMHWFVYKALFFVLDYNWITSIFGMGLAILCANLVHQYFEKPIMKLKLV